MNQRKVKAPKKLVKRKLPLNLFSKSILAKILLFFLSIQFLSLSIFLTYDSILNKNRIEKFALETEGLIAFEINKSADIILMSIEKSLNKISREKSVTDILISTKYEEMMIEDFKNYADINGTINGFMMGTVDDQLFMYPQKTTEYGYKPTQQEWYQKAIKNRGRVIYSSPIIDKKTGKLTIVIAKTVNKDAGVIGVVGAVVSMDMFQNLIADITYSKSGYAFAVDSDGTIVAHHDISKVGTSIAQQTYFKEMTNEKQNYLDFLIDGKKQFMKYVTNGRTGWKFAVAMNDGEIQQQIFTAVIKNILLYGVILLIVAVLIIKFASNMVNPIKKTVNQMEKVKQGNLSVKLDIIGKDEIAQLMESFNQMVEQIRNLVQGISFASSTILNASTQYHQICESNAMTSKEVAVSLGNITSGSEDQMQQANKIRSQTQEFGKQIDLFTGKSQEVSKETLHSKEINVSGLGIIQDLHGVSQKNIENVEQGLIEFDGLHEKTEAVVKIIERVEDIARQTNMISLNASIEAARAGEYGRGFGVIANEIHSLAEEVQNLSSDTYKYLQEIVNQTNSTVQIMNIIKETSYKEYQAMLETKNVFEKIEECNNVIQEKVEDLSQSAKRMNGQKDNILSGINQIIAISADASNWSKQIYSDVNIQSENNQKAFISSEELLETAKELQEKINVFRM